MPPVEAYRLTTVTRRLSTIALCPQAHPHPGPSSATVSAMTKVRQAVGAHGERLAEQHLTEQGLVVLARNWRCSDGEIDLILRDGPDEQHALEAIVAMINDKFGEGE